MSNTNSVLIVVATPDENRFYLTQLSKERVEYVKSLHEKRQIEILNFIEYISARWAQVYTPLTINAETTVINLYTGEI